MNRLNFDTGVKTYDINGVCEISINPTDSLLTSRLLSLVSRLDEKREQYARDIDNAEIEDIFDIASKFEADVRAEIDAALGTPVCDAVFGNMSVMSMANGLPVFCNLVFAILDEIDAGWESENAKTNARIAKYTDKYKKKV